MAQGIRSRPVVRAAAAGGLLLAAAIGAALAGGGCSDPQAAHRVDVAAIADGELLGAVLDACHGPLRNRMDRIAVEVQFADGQSNKVFAQLPESLRTTGPNGALLLVGTNGWRLGDEQPLDAATLQWLQQLRSVVDVAAFGPLQRATGCERGADNTFVLVQPDGSRCELRLRDGTLLPHSLTTAAANGSPTQRIEFLEYLQTSKTMIAQRVRHPELGECTLRFDLADLQWAADLFAPPAGRVATQATTTVSLPTAGGGEVRSATPILGTAAAMQLVILSDPGDWPARAAAYAPLHQELERQNQKIAGFPMLFRDGERDLLAAPFRQRDGGPAFSAPAGWEIRSLPASELLVVYPAAGDFTARRDAAETMLREALLALDRKANGPIVAQPFLHLQDGTPPATKLTAPVVRCSVLLLPAK